MRTAVTVAIGTILLMTLIMSGIVIWASVVNVPPQGTVIYGH